MCSAAVIILPPDTEAKEIEVSEVIPKITDNIEAEITAIAVALEAAARHRSSTDTVSYTHLTLPTNREV